MPALKFRPQLLDSLQHYQRAWLAGDISAGMTVAVVALPLAMAFGIASGVKPEQGLITAIVGGFLISLLGGSRVQIGGPAGAFVALLYGIVERYGVANMMLATMMAGIVLFAFGALRLGGLIRFIPIPIIIGFTNGIAVIIAVQQLKDFMGLRIARMPASFFAQLDALGQALPTVHWPTLALGLASLALLIFWPKTFNQRHWHRPWYRAFARLPGTVIVLAIGILAVRYASMSGLTLETIGSKFGGIPQALPQPSLPSVQWSSAQHLLAPTLSIAFLCAIESLLCARVADGMTRDRHNPNQELMAQGIANVVSPLFGGIAATGTIARTMTNIRSGAHTPIAGLVHAIVLLLVVLVLAPLASSIPLVSLAAILLVIAWNMGEWREFSRLRQFSMQYRIVLLSTFLLTVIFDITVAVEIGLILAIVFFIYRISQLTRIEQIPLESLNAQPPQRPVAAFTLSGSLFFGSVNKLETISDQLNIANGTVLLDMHQVINVDATGLDSLQSLLEKLQAQGSQLILLGLQAQPKSIFTRSGFAHREGYFESGDSLEAALSKWGYAVAA